MGFDVAIVGGGAVGCLTAKHCAEKGLSAAVLEEHAKAGKLGRCTGLVSKRGLGETGVNFEKTVLNEIRGCNIRAGTRVMAVDAKRAVALVIDRQAFDEECRREASQAKFHFNSRVTGFKGNNVIAGKRKIESRYVVGADGANSFTARALGFPAIPSKGYALAWQGEYSGARVEDAEFVDVFLEPEKIRGFFGWFVPVSRRVVRVGLATRNHAELAEAKGFLLAEPRVAAALENARKKSEFNALIPLEARSKTVKGNALLVGDAAGQVKATTGGGIVFGAKCSAVLAECLARGEPAAYEKAWRRKASTLKWHSRLRSFYDSLDSKSLGLVLSTAKVLGGSWLLSRFGDMDYVVNPRGRHAPKR